MPSILQAFLNGEAPENEAVTLRRLREQRLRELEHNSDLEAEYGQPRLDIYPDTGDGMRHISRPAAQNYASGATHSDIAHLRGDLADDPYTGIEAQRAQRDTERRLADESAYMSPGATEVRQSQQGDKLAQLLAVPVQQGQNALALERERQHGLQSLQQGEQDFTRELTQGMGAPNEMGGRGFVPNIGSNGKVALRGIPPHKPTTEEQRALDTMGSLEALGPEMLAKYEAEYPGISQDPTKYGGPTDMIKSFLGAGAYKMGYMGDESADQMKQLTGYLEAVLPRMLSSGRINREQYTDLKLHVPQLGLSPGANFARAKYVLDQILPHVRAAVGTQPGSADPYSDPNYQPR